MLAMQTRYNSCRSSLWRLCLILGLVATVAQENAQNHQPHPASGAISYTLVGSVELTDASAPVESVSLPQCGRKCGDRKRPPCVGFTWLSPDNIDEGTLADSRVGQCQLLECLPDEKAKKGRARLYLRVHNKMTPQYGVLWKVPEDYRKLCTFAYRPHQTKLNFTSADAACRKEGGRLLFTRTPAQHLEVNSNLTRSIPHWIGMADVAGNRTFRWLDGSDIGVSEWGDDQPNNYRGGTSEPQSCVMLHNGVWNDEQCSKQHSYICQILFVDI